MVTPRELTTADVPPTENFFLEMILQANFSHDPFTNASRTSPHAPLMIKAYGYNGERYLLVILIYEASSLPTYNKHNNNIIIIIVFKAQFEIFYNLLTAPQIVCSTYTEVARAHSCASHMHHIEHLSHATQP